MRIKDSLLFVKKIVLSPKAFGKYLGQCIKLYRYNDLLQFANEEQTDKGFPGHNYVRIYDFFMRNNRDSLPHFCEVGLLRHAIQRNKPSEVYPEAPSLRMWRKYLPNTHLVGFDIQKFEQSQDDNCVIIQGDQSSREDLQKITNHHSGYDVIIDDALHASPHQQITLSFLFPHLKSGGVFFIEDLRFQPEGFERDGVSTTLELLKKLEATGVWESPLSTPEEKKILEEEVKEIHFFESLKGRDPVFGAGALAAIIKK